MNKSFLILLNKLITVLVIVLSLGILSWAFLNYRRAKNIVNPERVISFTATGKVVAQPDVALIDISVITQGKEANEVQNMNNKKMKRIIEFVKQSGVQDKDVKTIRYSLDPQYDYQWCLKEEKSRSSCPPKIVSYTLTQTIEVKIRNFDKINSIIGGLTERGANTISQIRFTIDEPEQYKNEARIQALNKIKKRAKILSQATGIKLGRIVAIHEEGIPYYSSSERASVFPKAISGGELSQEAPIEKGSLEITATMTVSYEIK